MFSPAVARSGSHLRLQLLNSFLQNPLNTKRRRSFIYRALPRPLLHEKDGTTRCRWRVAVCRTDSGEYQLVEFIFFSICTLTRERYRPRSLAGVYALGHYVNNSSHGGAVISRILWRRAPRKSIHKHLLHPRPILTAVKYTVAGGKSRATVWWTNRRPPTEGNDYDELPFASPILLPSCFSCSGTRNKRMISREEMPHSLRYLSRGRFNRPWLLPYTPNPRLKFLPRSLSFVCSRCNPSPARTARPRSNDDCILGLRRGIRSRFKIFYRLPWNLAEGGDDSKRVLSQPHVGKLLRCLQPIRRLFCITDLFKRKILKKVDAALKTKSIAVAICISLEKKSLSWLSCKISSLFDAFFTSKNKIFLGTTLISNNYRIFFSEKIVLLHNSIRNLPFH